MSIFPSQMALGPLLPSPHEGGGVPETVGACLVHPGTSATELCAVLLLFAISCTHTPVSPK